MPYNRPGASVLVTRDPSDAALNHDSPVTKANFVGVAVKQKAESWKTGYAGLNVIADNERYLIIAKGIVMVPTTGISTPAVGDAVYINTTTNALTKTPGAGVVPYGRITEIAGTRGTPTGKVRIDLDAKDAI